MKLFSLSLSRLLIVSSSLYNTNAHNKHCHFTLKISKEILLNMTGSIHRYNRQSSSTTTTGSTKEGVHQPKLRRCSSADEHNPSEFIPEIHFQKNKFSFKRGSPTSDIDSGTEEVEQQSEHVFLPAPSDTDEQIPQLDEGFSELEREEDFQLSVIKRDRKFCFFLLGHYDECNCIICF